MKAMRLILVLIMGTIVNFAGILIIFGLYLLFPTTVTYIFFGLVMPIALIFLAYQLYVSIKMVCKK